MLIVAGAVFPVPAFLLALLFVLELAIVLRSLQEEIGDTREEGAYHAADKGCYDRRGT